MAVYFLSDTHLGAANIPDEHEAERRLVRFLEYIRHDAEAIYLVGDILDYWFEYRCVVPRGYVRFFGKLAELADSGVKITWLIGNHDIWIFDYLPNELGITVVDGNIETTIYNKNIFISHGDGVGVWPWQTRFIRSMFRNKVCQKLYGGLHPRWTIPFAHGWSKSSRKKDELGTRKVTPKETVGILREFSKEYISLHPDIDYMVFGHLHALVDEKIGDKTRMIVLGDWNADGTYARLDETGLSLHSFE